VVTSFNKTRISTLNLTQGRAEDMHYVLETCTGI